MSGSVQPAGMENENIVFLEGHTQKIRKLVEGIADDFCAIGFYLWEINKYKWYEIKGYKSIVEFGLNELGFKKSSTYNFIGICEKFSIRNGDYMTASLCDKYKPYSYTQLSEMLSISLVDPSEVVPATATKQEIRDIKKSLKGNVVDVKFTIQEEYKNDQKALKQDQVSFNYVKPNVEKVSKVPLDIENLNLKNELSLLKSNFDDLNKENEELKVKILDLQKKNKLKSEKVQTAPVVSKIDLSLILEKLDLMWSKEIDDDVAAKLDKQISFIRQFNL